MKNTYKTDDPQFSDTLKELETTDPAHADLFNEINKELFENTIYLKKKIKELESKGGVAISSEEPENTDALWVDTSAGGVLKYYSKETEAWNTVASTWS